MVRARSNLDRHLPEDSLRVVVFAEEAPVERLEPLLTPRLGQQEGRHEDRVGERPRREELPERLAPVQVEVAGQHDEEHGHEREQQPSRQRVADALAHDETQIEQPVAEDRVREQGRNRQKEQRRPRNRGWNSASSPVPIQ